MKDYGLIQGGPKCAIPLILGKDTVYIHTNITQCTDSDGNPIENLWNYNEIQYTYPEYFKLINDQLTEVQLAITSMYEGGAV